MNTSHMLETIIFRLLDDIIQIFIVKIQWILNEFVYVELDMGAFYERKTNKLPRNIY